MSSLSRSIVRAVLLALALSAIGSAGIGLVATPSATAQRAEGTSLHRVVWDEWKHGRKGTHLLSANVDGTDRRRIYDSRIGFTTELTPDRDGRRVAFATCCRDSLPPLVVVPVMGGEALEPLKRHPQIEVVGGIGWSPDGRRLAFEGMIRLREQSAHFLWTIRPNGTGLRRVLRLTYADQSVINPSLAWTRSGIIYSDGSDLRIARNGASRIFIPHGTTVTISGDGRYIFTTRGRGSLWIGRSDGTDQRRLRLPRRADGLDISYRSLALNHSGRQLLAYRERWDLETYERFDDVVRWKVAEGPRSATPIADLDGSTLAVKWN